MPRMETLVANLAGKTRRERWLGRDYLVAPLTLIVPGVLPGSRGPLYYPPEEVAREPDSWNHVPIVVYHPTLNGTPTTARRPDVLERQGVGYVFNAGYRGKLRAEGWFDIERTKVVDPRVLTALEAGNPFELSTGLYTDNEPAPGGSVFNSASGPRPYTYIARNYRPDHLAILPDRKGACSVADGCGVLVNELVDLDLGPVVTEYPLGNAFDPSQARDSAGRWTHEAVAREVLSAVHEHEAQKRFGIRLHDLRQTVHARLPGTTKDQVNEVLVGLHKSHHIILDKDSRPQTMIPPALKDAALTGKDLGRESSYSTGADYYTSARPGRNASSPLPTFPTAQAAPASVPAPVGKAATAGKAPLDVHMQKTKELVDNPPSPDVARAHVDKLAKDLNKDQVLKVANWVYLGATSKKEALKKIHDRILRINSSENHRDQSTHDAPAVFPGLDLLTANKFNPDQPRDSKGRWMPAGMAKGTGRTPSTAGQSAMVHAALGKKADVSSHVNAIHTLRSRGTDLSKEEITAHVNRLGRHLNKAQVHDVARATGVEVSPTKKDTLAAIHEHLDGARQQATKGQAAAEGASRVAAVARERYYQEPVTTIHDLRTRLESLKDDVQFGRLTAAQGKEIHERLKAIGGHLASAPAASHDVGYQNPQHQYPTSQFPTGRLVIPAGQEHFSRSGKGLEVRRPAGGLKGMTRDELLAEIRVRHEHGEGGTEPKQELKRRQDYATTWFSHRGARTADQSRQLVETELAAGRPVPHEVLSLYPSLEKQHAGKAGTVSPTVPDSHAELAQATAGKQGFTGPFQRGPHTVVRHDDSGHTIEAEAGNHSGRFAVKDPSNVVHSRHDTAEAAVAAIQGVNRIGTGQGTVDKELRDRAAQAGKSARPPGQDISERVLRDAGTVSGAHNAGLRTAAVGGGEQTATEKKAVEKLNISSEGLSLGHVSNPLVYSSAFRGLNKTEHQAILKAVASGRLRVHEVTEGGKTDYRLVKHTGSSR